MIAADLLTGIDPVTFALGLGFEPDDWQARVLRWKGRRLLLNCSRQSGKSSVCGLLALHHAVYHPNFLALVVSPSLRQSSELFRIIQGFLGRLENAPMKVEDNKLSVTFENNSRICSIPSSEATIRGFSGVGMLIVDEAARVPDPLYFAVRPMLAVSGGALAMMSTPAGKRGVFFESWTGEEDWERIEITADRVPRITPEFLEEERRTLGSWWFEQEYFCQFKENVDAVFSHEFILKAFSDDVEPLFQEA